MSKSLRSVALPAEHGGWGFWLEPVLLGLLVAFSGAGVLIGLAALSGFLARQPLKLLLLARRRGVQTERSRLALRVLIIYLGLAGVFLLLAILDAGAVILLPLAAASPLALIALVYDSRGQSRAWQAEVGGALAMTSIAVSIALAGGWPPLQSVGLAVILAARVVPSIFYVRQRLLAEKGKPFNPTLPALLHGGALMILAFLSRVELLPYLTVIGGAVLLGRALFGLSSYRRPLAAKWIGFQEIAYGLLVVILAAVGFA